MRNLEHVKHVIIKIGSTSLCNEDGQLDKERILKLIQQIAILKRKGLKVTLVSSGAISSGMGVLNLSEKPKEISKKQALAAIGQAHLMQIYEDLFSLFHFKKYNTNNMLVGSRLEYDFVSEGMMGIHVKALCVSINKAGN